MGRRVPEGCGTKLCTSAMSGLLLVATARLTHAAPAAESAHTIRFPPGWLGCVAKLVSSLYPHGTAHTTPAAGLQTEHTEDDMPREHTSSHRVSSKASTLNTAAALAATRSLLHLSYQQLSTQARLRAACERAFWHTPTHARASSECEISPQAPNPASYSHATMGSQPSNAARRPSPFVKPCKAKCAYHQPGRSGQLAADTRSGRDVTRFMLYGAQRSWPSCNVESARQRDLINRRVCAPSTQTSSHSRAFSTQRQFSTDAAAGDDLPASVDVVAQVAIAAFAAAEGSVQTDRRVSWVVQLMEMGAAGQEWVHATSGLPWWLSIPLTTWGVRTLLLPFSMWQARTVRTNYHVYREAVGLTDKELDAQAQVGAGHTSAVRTLRRSRLLLSNFALLRAKLSAPHPAWIVINPLIQVPVFMLLGGSLRFMAANHWPELTTGGALWFTDLTQVALVVGSYPWSFPPYDTTPWQLPLGLIGLTLPCAMLAMTLTSLRLGFGASGLSLAPLPEDTVGRLMRALPFLLYTLTCVNGFFAMQLPHAPLLHWIATASFTLNLQMWLQQPGFRRSFQLPTPTELQASLTRIVNQRLQQLTEQGGTLGPGRGYIATALSETTLKQVADEKSSDVLVILGAQHSAQQRYRDALYCFDRALQIEPKNVRAHYSRGQVFSLNKRWSEAQACFRRAAELSTSSVERGQALYCIATTLHIQGKVDESIALYEEARREWPDQPVVAFSMANALLQLGRLHEANGLVQDVLRSNRAGPFVQPLQAMAAMLADKLHLAPDDAARAHAHAQANTIDV